jgi:hypothetical protein
MQPYVHLFLPPAVRQIPSVTPTAPQAASSVPAGASFVHLPPTVDCWRCMSIASQVVVARRQTSALDPEAVVTVTVLA